MAIENKNAIFASYHTHQFRLFNGLRATVHLKIKPAFLAVTTGGNWN
jgi:hypothetical protein